MTRKDLTLCLCYVLALFVPVTIARLVSPTGIDKTESVRQTNLGQYRETGLEGYTLEDYNQAISRNPRYASAYYNRGEFYFQSKQYDKALADFTQAITLRPLYADAFQRRGITYDYLKQYNKAIADYTKAITLNPQDANAYSGRGMVYQILQNYPKALAEYNAAISKDKNDLTATINTGLIYYEQENKKAAMIQFQQALEIEKDLAEVHLLLAVTSHITGQSEKGRELAKAALKLDKTIADPKVQRESLWGEKAIADTRKLLSTLP
jgi:tetratricopeptide (TPR) repeat protein